MCEFSFYTLAEEYGRRIETLRSLCTCVRWPEYKKWLEPIDILLTHHSIDELTHHLLPYIRPLGVRDVQGIEIVELSRCFGRTKNDFLSRIIEYSDITALYYLWSEKLKDTNPEEAKRALWRATLLLVKLIGIMEAIELMEIQKKKRIKQENARSNGGKAKASRYKSVKQEIVRMLSYKEQGEYNTKLSVANDILEDVWLYIEKLTKEIRAENNRLPTHKQTRREPGLVKDNLIRLILDWSRNDVSVQDAFNKVIRHST